MKRDMNTNGMENNVSSDFQWVEFTLLKLFCLSLHLSGDPVLKCQPLPSFLLHCPSLRTGFTPYSSLCPSMWTWEFTGLSAQEPSTY